MQCIRCQRTPAQIERYAKEAFEMEMSPHEYVRMDVETYHPHSDMFCCHECYADLGYPLYTDLVGWYENVIPLRREA
ncbi:hypothetical protein SAMN04490247_3169 [Salimicrobium halophilum]|uniref:Uncharacterized protein n=1 Tax=Salimicrobium halophilum TaxID=86666 RepID=A0A1G8WEW4_9BACI|nr:hypothetical protein SAMN04490247_3169 [Salimicrobium halophilum]